MQVTDGVLTDTIQVNVNVESVNDAPVAADDSAGTGAGAQVTIDVRNNDSDMDEDALVVTAVGAASNGTPSHDGSSVFYTPNGGFTGTDTFTYTISDGLGGADTATVTVFVSDDDSDNDGIPDGTEGSDDSDGDGIPDFRDLDSDGDGVPDADEGAGDTDNDGIPDFQDEDSDGDGISDYDEGTADSDGDGIPDRQESNTADTDNDGTPDVDDDDSDGDGISDYDEGTADSDGDGIPDFRDEDSDGDGTPDATEGSADTDNDGILDRRESNSNDADGDGLADFEDDDDDGDGLPTAEEGTGDADGDGTPNYLDLDSDNDGILDAEEGANDDSYLIVEDSQENLLEVLANDSDPQGDPLTITAVGTPDEGGALINNGNSLTYTPAAHFFGTEVFTYTVSDGKGYSDTATVLISIDNVDDPPYAIPDNFTIVEDSVNNLLDVLANDIDLDNEGLSVVAVEQVSEGSYSFSGSGITYSPFQDFVGEDVFIYTIDDGQRTYDTTYITVTVTNVNDPPLFSSEPVTTATESSLYSYAITATDVDTLVGDSLTVTAPQKPDWLSLTDNGDGTAVLSGTPGNADVGDHGIELQVADLAGVTATQPFTITVININNAPEAADDSYSIAEDTPTTFDVLANDDDEDSGDTLSVHALGTPDQGGTVQVNGSQIDYTPPLNFSGTELFTYTVADDSIVTDTATVTVTISNVNDDPLFSSTAVTDATEDLVYSYAITTTDVDLVYGDSLTVTAPVKPDWLSLTDYGDGTALLTGTPDNGQVGGHTVTLQVEDAAGVQISQNFVIFVTNVNDGPEAADDSYSMDEDGTRLITPLDNDTDVDSDDMLTLQELGKPDNGGVVVDEGGGSVRYTPAADFYGTEVFTYTVTDSYGASATATVTLAVDEVNDDPQAGADSFTVSEDSSDNSLDVLANDDSGPDPEQSDTLQIDSVSTPDNGGTATTDGATVSYAPAADFFGTEVFTYTLGDGRGGSATGVITVTVTNLNDPPVAASDTVETDEDLNLVIDVLDNDSILPDVGETLTITGIGYPDRGAVLTNNGTSITYDPAANFNGTEVFTYTIGDGNGLFDTATVTVTVNAVNDAPIAGDDFTSAERGETVVLNVLANDIDPEGSPVTLVSVAVPEHGTAAISGTNQVVYTPTMSFYGVELFKYTVSDGEKSSQGNIAVLVDVVNVEPTITTGEVVTVTMDEDNVPTPFDLTVTAMDYNSDTLSWSVETQPGHGSAAIADPASGVSAEVLYTPDEHYNGSDSFVVAVADGRGGTDTIQVIVDIAPVNDAPFVDNVSDQSMPPDGELEMPVEIWDDETPLEELIIQFSSSNQELVPDDQIVLVINDSASSGGGSGNPGSALPGMTLMITPTPGKMGTSVITIYLSDGLEEREETFVLTVQLYQIFIPFANAP